MNRFRELKQKLIKSKRDSQKLQQCPYSQTQLEDWVQKQLQYYGINKQSYRLKQLRNMFKQNQKVQSQIYKQNPQNQTSIDSSSRNQIISLQRNKINNIQIRNKQKDFSKKNNSHQIEINNVNQISFEHISIKQIPITLSKSNIKQNTSTLSKKLICKKVRNEHVSSMNDAGDILQNRNKKKSQQRNNYRSYQAQQQQQLNNEVNNKQLDYYTLILQLTAELNYSRLNRQQSNEKSILNQIKNLISYIQGKQSNSTGIDSAQMNSNEIIKLQSGQYSQQTNKKSNHTFSSVFSNQSIIQQHQHNSNNGSSNCSQKRKIKYKLINQCQQQHSFYNNKNITQSNNHNQQNNSQHNQTFQSINAFQQNQLHQSQQQNQQENKTSIIDLVNDYDQYNNNNNDILIQQSQDHQNSIYQNSPLSRITQHQSQYTQSANPSINVSPSKYTPDKLTKTTFISMKQKQNKFLPHQMQRHIESLYAQNIFKKNIQSFNQQNISKNNISSQHHQSNNNWIKFLPQNQLILKKLSDKLQNTYQTTNNLFDQSLQYKRILYMLDSQYGNSDYKNRTFTSLFGQKSNITQSASDKENYHYQIKIGSQQSAKSFNKEIFQSNQQSSNKNHNHYGQQNICLMKKLDSLFKTQHKKQQPSPRLLNFASQNQLQTPINQTNFINNHKRSQTSYQSFQNQNLNKTNKYRFNLFSQLSQQIHEQSQENAFDNEKYVPMKTQYEQDSIFHKVSRNSYLTSSSAQNSYGFTSSQSQCLDGNKKSVRKGNLIVKKNKKLQEQKVNQSKRSGGKSKYLIVKKQKSNELKSEKSQNEVYKQNKYNQNLFDQNNMQSKQQLTFIQMSNQRRSDQNNSIISKNNSQNNSNHNSSSSSNKSQNQKQKKNNKIKSPSLNESKVSISSNRQIKYKIYASPSQFKGNIQKQDKRKVLKDIVSVLNTKYNKNIKLKEQRK